MHLRRLHATRELRHAAADDVRVHSLRADSELHDAERLRDGRQLHVRAVRRRVLPRNGRQQRRHKLQRVHADRELLAVRAERVHVRAVRERLLAASGRDDERDELRRMRRHQRLPAVPEQRVPLLRVHAAY